MDPFSSSIVAGTPGRETASALSGRSLLRHYATPLALALMLIVGGSGMALFLHLAGGEVKGLHKWLGLGLVAAVVLHLARNGRAVKILMAAPRTQVLVGACSLALALFFSLAPPSGGTGAARTWLAAGERTPLTALAPVLGVSSEALVARLAEEGIDASPDQTLAYIARASRSDPQVLMGYLTETARLENPRLKP